MVINIKYKDGDEIKDREAIIPITGSSKVSASLMESDYLLLKFILEEPVSFEIGDFVDLADPAYDDLGLYPSVRKKYVVTEKQVPTYVPSSDAYEYQLKLNAYYWQWNNRIFKFDPLEFGQEASWSLTGAVSGFMKMYVENLQAYGFGDYKVIIQEGYDYNLYLTFDGVKMIDALSNIINTINSNNNVHAEWWVGKDDEGNDAIFIGDCTLGETTEITDEEYEDGRKFNAVSIKPKDGDTEFANRIIAFGGTQNISPRYRKLLWFEATKVKKYQFEDVVKTQFTPDWFRHGEREYKESTTVSYRTDTSEAQHNKYKSDYTVRNNGYTEWGHVFEPQYFSCFQNEVDYNINFERIIGYVPKAYYEGYILINERLTTAYWLSGEITIRARCVSKPNVEPVVLFSKKWSSEGKKVENVASALSCKGTAQITESEFVDSMCVIEVIIKLYRLVETVDNYQYDYIKDPYAEYAHDPFNALFVFNESTVTYRPIGAYRVNTKIKFEGDDTWRDCIVNPDFNDVTADGARHILVDGYEVEDGKRYTFPTIVKGLVTSSYFTAPKNNANVMSVVQKNLMLPIEYIIKYNDDRTLEVVPEAVENCIEYNEKNYVDANLHVTDNNVVEQVVVFDSIFPRMKDTSISEVGNYVQTTKEDASTPQTIWEDGEAKTKHYFYQFKSENFIFSDECLMPGVELKIHFQTGKLAGMTFGLAHNPNMDVFGDDAPRFEIINNLDYGIEMPNDLAYPQEGDIFIVTGWNIEAIEGNGNIIDEAEKELLDETLKLVQRISYDPHTYDVDMMSDSMKDEDTTFDIFLGKAVTLRNKFLFPTEEGHKRDLRIIGYEVKLDIPYDTPHLTVGENKEYSKINAIAKASGKKEQSVAVYAGNGVVSTGEGGSGSGGGGSTTTVIPTWKDIDGKPTTLAGYGITDAYIDENGIIHIGSRSIRPLTDVNYSQIIDNVSRNFLLKSAFDELFEKVTEGDVTYIRAKYGLASVGFISAFGTNPQGGSGGGGGVGSIIVNGSQFNPNADGVITLPDYPSVQTLTWANVTGKPSWIGDTKPTYTASEVGALPATHAASGVTAEKIANWDSAFGWGDHSKAGYLKEHQSLAGYATEKWVTDKGYATQTWVEGKKYLTGITSEMVIGALGFTPLSDDDGRVISESINDLNRYIREIDAVASATFRSQQTQIGNIATSVVDAHYRIDDIVSTFNSMFELDSDGNIRVKRGIYSVSFVSAYGSNPSGGSGGGGGVGSIMVNGSQFNPNADGVITLPNYPTSLTWGAISGKPTFATVATSGKYSDLSGTPTIPTTLPASDVYAWAKKSSLAASDVPNLDWSKITTGKPTTLAGYGITDAKIVNGVITLGSNTITPVTSLAGYATETWVINKGYVTSSGVTSIAIKNGTGITGGSDTAVTSTGTFTIGINSTYQTYISNGNTAYGWGNHANAGYAYAAVVNDIEKVIAAAITRLNNDIKTEDKASAGAIRTLCKMIGELRTEIVELRKLWRLDTDGNLHTDYTVVSSKNIVAYQ